MQFKLSPPVFNFDTSKTHLFSYRYVTSVDVDWAAAKTGQTDFKVYRVVRVEDIEHLMDQEIEPSKLLDGEEEIILAHPETFTPMRYVVNRVKIEGEPCQDK